MHVAKPSHTGLVGPRRASTLALALDQRAAQEGVDERRNVLLGRARWFRTGLQLNLITLLKVTSAGTYGTRSSGRGP